MLNLVNVTQARNNLSKLIEEVFVAQKTYVVVRDSIPQAVIIPYPEYQSKEEKWQEEVEKLMKKGKNIFASWLKKEKIKKPATEDEIYQIINKVEGRR